MQRITSCSLLLSFLALPALANSTELLSPQSVARRLEGLLVYEADDLEIQMRSCSVQLEAEPAPADETAVYLYQEQARSDRLDQPYRQRLLRLSSPDDQTVFSDSFRLATPDQWVGLCASESRTLTAADLEPAHCRVTLRSVGDRFEGETPPQGCPSQYRGAAFVRNRVVLLPNGMRTYDQGLDADGNVVWGTDGEPYIFQKRP